MSGGQKQRLSIARAICKNPDVFIFDDSFSALDMKTDARLREALRPIIKDMVVLVGNEEAIKYMTDNNRENSRYTGLCSKLKENGGKS